jgi:large repetitive protein
MKNNRILSLLAPLAMFIAYLTMSSYSAGITGSSTSGCGGGSCHGASSANTTLSITGLPANYTLGQAYTVSVTVTNTAQSKAGFDLSVTTGAFSSPSTGSSLNGTMETKHTTPKTLTAGSATWTVVWTAPSSGTSPVTFNLAGNAVNANTFSSGDSWALSSLIVAAPMTGGVTVTATSTNVLCNGASNGSITATGANGTSPYNYKLNAGLYQSSGTFTGLAPGTYTITVKDGVNATATIVKTITQATAISTTVTSTNVLCFGLNTGTATIVGTGGTLPYSYSWAPSGGSAATATGLIAGTYTCTITDANGCIKTATKVITQPAAPLLISANITNNNICFGTSVGSATASATGGTGALSFVWMPGALIGATANFLAAGVYTVAASDANSCTSITTITILQSQAIVGTALSTNATCFGASNGSSSVNATGGTAPLTYAWAPGGSTSNSVSNLAAGAYTCTITDASNCTTSLLVSIGQAPAIVLTATATNTSCQSSNDGTINVVSSGGTPPMTFAWTPNVGTSSSISNLSGGVYTMVATDANNCSKSTVVTVAQSSDTANATFNFTQANSTATAIQASASYQWYKCNPFTMIAGATSQNYNVTANGSYALVVSKGGCKDTAACQSIILGAIGNTLRSTSIVSMMGNNLFLFENTESTALAYTIRNTQGAMLNTGTMQIGANTINMQAFASGLYLLDIKGSVFKLLVK